MTIEGEQATPGWYPAPGNLSQDDLRYWDGAQWLAEPRHVPPSREVVLASRAAIREEAIRRAGAQPGEGIPFHELYMRRKAKKGNWRSGG